MPRRLVSAVLIFSALAVTPAVAQHARARGDGGGNRGGDRGGARTEGSRGQGEVRRAAPPRSPNGGGSYNRPRQDDGGGQSYQAGQYQAQPNARRYGAGPSDVRRDYRGSQAYTGQPYAYQHRAVPRPYYSNGPYYRAPYYKPYYGRPYYNGGYYYGAHPYYYGPRYVYPNVVTVVPYYPYYYRPQFSIGVYYGAGGAYPYGHTPSGYYDPVPGRAYGGVRITDAPRDAQVFADGYYVGIVDDFDGAYQHMNLESGQHQVEIRAPGLEPIAFDIVVQPGRTITLRAEAY